MATKQTIPTVWDPEQLEAELNNAVQIFVNRRLKNGDPEFLRLFAESEAMIQEFLDLSGNLGRLNWEIFLERSDLLEDIGRFVAGPPISADDFRTLLGFRRVRKGEASEVKQALYLINGLVDPSRFPWVAEARGPNLTELRSAIVATASLRAVERARTERRTQEQERQEGRVAEFLRSMPLVENQRVADPDAEMQPGSFKRGVKFEGKQCDVLVKLFDGRYLAIECKSSNSAVNSIKRLNDVSDKAQVWKEARGAKVVTAGVLAGVFDRSSLETAQGKGVFLFWEHDLQPIHDFILSSK